MLKNAFYTLNTNIITFVMALTNSIIINRILGPKILGKFFLLAVASTLIVNLGTLGINASSSTLVAKDRSKVGILFLHSLLLSAVLSILVGAVFFVGMDFFSRILLKGVEAELIIPTVLTLPFLLYLTCWSSLIVGMEKISLLNKYNLIANLIPLCLSVTVLILFKKGLRELLYATLITNAILAVVTVYLLVKVKDEEAPVRFDFNLFMESLNLGIKIHFGNIAHFLFHRIDFFFVNYFLGNQALGYYGLANRLAERAWMIVSPIYTVAFAKITSASLEESVDLVTRILRNIIFLLFLISVTLGGVGYWLILLLYGEEFLPAYIPMVLLLPGIISLGASWFMGLFFVGHLKKPEITTIIAWIGLAISLVLYILLIKTLGVAGASLASSITYTFIFLATLREFRKFSKHSLAETLIIQKKDIHSIATGLRGIIFASKE